MADRKKKHYEHPDLWSTNYLEIPRERERIEETINAIPPDTHTVLDVGCGNGCFVNTLARLSGRFTRVIGLDSSEEALKYVQTEKVKGSIVNLPFDDASFDLVTSLEVLEHLPETDFKSGVYELQRVSNKYIIITVPNNQDLASSLVRCPNCYCWFNPSFHVRSFHEGTLHRLFKGFNAIQIKEIGPVTRSYNGVLSAFYCFCRRRVPPEGSVCPQCGYQHKQTCKNLVNKRSLAHFLSSILCLLNRLVKVILPARKRRVWLLGLYKKAHM